MMAKFKGFGKPPLPGCLFLKDLKNKLSSGELQQGTEIASKWLQSLSDKQIKRLSNLKEPSPDLVAVVIYLVTLEQGLIEFELREEDLQTYLNNFFSLFSLVQIVNGGLMEVTHFPAIHSQEEFGRRLTHKGEKLAQLLKEAHV
jgi:hypothetical protein